MDLFPALPSNLAVIVSFDIQSIKRSRAEHQMFAAIQILMDPTCIGSMWEGERLETGVCARTTRLGATIKTREAWLMEISYKVEQKFDVLMLRSINLELF